jgi:uncharacterized protein
MVDMKVALTGSSGFLGTALERHLDGAGHDVVRLVRREPSGADERGWDPAHGELDPTHLADVGAVVNLGGVPIDHWPLTKDYRRQILQSRLETTGTLARTIAGSDHKPALVNASGINYYGSDRGDERIDEDSGPGTGFLAGICGPWEAATEPAATAGARVAVLRTGLVMHRAGGVLRIAKIPFRAGVGGRLGNGRQFFPSISLADYVAAVTRIATSAELSGPFNLVAPVPATNEEFTKALGRRLRRPTVIPVPALAVRAAAGAIAGELLGSLNASPARLLAAGFEFRHPTIDEQIDAAFD